MSRAIQRASADLLLIELGSAADEREKILSWIDCRYGESTPFIILSAVSDGELAAQALNGGAEDFLVMPLAPIELLARINAIQRRLGFKPHTRKIHLCDFLIDGDTRNFSYKDKAIELTPREFTMAWLFFSKPGVYISRETIGNAIWGVDSDIAGRTIEQHIYKLRKKLSLGPERGLLIRTAYSQGYRLEICTASKSSNTIYPCSMSG